MVVQSYFSTENQESFSEPEGWLEKVEEMGLTGQASLMSNGAKSPIPFRFMDREWKRIVHTLCNREEAVDKYSKSPIPLEVLGLIWTAQHDNHFDEIVVCFSDQDPDPFVIGKKGERSWDKDEYLIARWGEENQTKDQLREKAVRRWIDVNKAKLLKISNDVKRMVDNIDATARQFVAGETVESFYWNP